MNLLVMKKYLPLVHDTRDDIVIDELPKINFARKDLADIFLTAAEVADYDPEQALFLYNHIYDVDPNYMNGELKEFIDNENNRLIPMRINRMVDFVKEYGEMGNGEKF